MGPRPTALFVEGAFFAVIAKAAPQTTSRTAAKRKTESRPIDAATTGPRKTAAD
jgi:hypothetical protein